jgi:hypothetical protein
VILIIVRLLRRFYFWKRRHFHCPLGSFHRIFSTFEKMLCGAVFVLCNAVQCFEVRSRCSLMLHMLRGEVRRMYLLLAQSRLGSTLDSAWPFSLFSRHPQAALLSASSSSHSLPSLLEPREVLMASPLRLGKSIFSKFCKQFCGAMQSAAEAKKGNPNDPEPQRCQYEHPSQPTKGAPGFQPEATIV